MPATPLLYQAAIDGLDDNCRVAIIHASSHPLLKELKNHSSKLNVTQHFKPEHDALTRLEINCSQHLEGEFDLILMLPSKNKQQTLSWMADAMTHLMDGGKLFMACANNHGAKSYESALKRLAGSISSSSKSKCRIFSARKTEALNSELTKQWLAEAEPRLIETVGLISQPGLFSWDRPDIGSQLLLEHLPESLNGTGMDLCCGYGLLSEHLLKHHPDIEKLYLIEADRLALSCAKKNTGDWSKKTKAHWIDATSGPLPLKLDWVVCNPPFHTGHDKDIDLGQMIVANACKSLKRNGKLYMVANRKLAYEALLDRMLMNHHVIVQKQGYKIIEATKGANPRRKQHPAQTPDDEEGWGLEYEYE